MSAVGWSVRACIAPASLSQPSPQINPKRGSSNHGGKVMLHFFRKKWLFTLLVSTALFIFGPAAKADPFLTGTVLTPPGVTVVPGLVPAGTQGTILASLVTPYSFTTTAGTTSGSLTTAVYRNSSGTLDFYYQIN